MAASRSMQLQDILDVVDLHDDEARCCVRRVDADRSYSGSKATDRCFLQRADAVLYATIDAEQNSAGSEAMTRCCLRRWTRSEATL